MESLHLWAQTSWIHALMVDMQWSWAVCEILHFVGMSVLFGAILVIDLRLMGLFRSVRLAAAKSLIPWVWTGFAINLTTGSLFFLSNPADYAANIGFRLKMLLLSIAGLNALWFQWKIAPKMRTWKPNEPSPPLARLIALISILAWTAVLLLGRLLPYIGTGVGTG